MLLVKNENKLVFSVEMRKAGVSDFEYYINLTLVAGWDYIDGESNRQGYVSAGRFVEDVQFEQVHVNILDETVLGRLKYENFEQVIAKDLNIEHILIGL